MNYSLFVANMTPHIPLPLSIAPSLRSLLPLFTPLYGNLQTAGEKKLTFAKPRGAEDGRVHRDVSKNMSLNNFFVIIL